MTVDLSKIKPGDEVTIRFTVKAVDQRNAWPHVECEPGDLDGGICESDYVSAGVAAIVSHAPKLGVGDRVRNIRCLAYPPAYEGGEIMAIADGWAMVRFAQTPGTVELADLERV